MTVDHLLVDLETIEALYENVGATHTSLLHNHQNTPTYMSSVFVCYCQRVQPDELERIRKHYETSDEEEVKLLDKPEQSVSHLL